MNTLIRYRRTSPRRRGRLRWRRGAVRVIGRDSICQGGADQLFEVDFVWRWDRRSSWIDRRGFFERSMSTRRNIVVCVRSKMTVFIVLIQGLINGKDELRLLFPVHTVRRREGRCLRGNRKGVSLKAWAERLSHGCGREHWR